MIDIKRDEVPEYLRPGSFYQSLLDEDEEITIPSDVLKPDTTIKSSSDLVHYLSSLRFWGVQDLTLDDVAPFIFDRTVTIECLPEELFSEFYVNFARLKPLLTLKTVSDEYMIPAVIEMGSCRWLQCLDNLGYPWPNHIVEQCITVGSVPCLEYSLSRGHKVTTSHIKFATMSGKFDCLKCLLDCGCGFEVEASATNNAAKFGHLSCLELLIQRNYPVSGVTMASAAQYGHLDVLKYLHQHGCPWDIWVVVNAATYGHLECLQYALENGCEGNLETIALNASFARSHTCLRYLFERGCPAVNSQICVNAAMGGSLECLVIAHEAGCPLIDRTSTVAIQGGHLDCLQYLHTHGCPFSERACLTAIEFGELECLMFIHSCGCALIEISDALEALTVYAERPIKESEEVRAEKLASLCELLDIKYEQDEYEEQYEEETSS